jgi:plasmid maintenance system killer protein
VGRLAAIKAENRFQFGINRVSAGLLRDLAMPLKNRLEALRHKRLGQHSLPINQR